MSITSFSAALLIVGLLLGFFYRKAFRFACWCLFFAGVGLSALILSLTGVMHWSLLGISIAFPLLVALAIAFYHEVHKKNKTHPKRTPFVAFAFGVMIVTLGGSLGGSVASGVTHLEQRGGATVGQFVNGG
jgi:phosphoglycerol transferase MdoB-like AlkP superfamily enzyme